MVVNNANNSLVYIATYVILISPEYICFTYIIKSTENVYAKQNYNHHSNYSALF
jgi:hypothetical protein